jgi:hypothetical protein
VNGTPPGGVTIDGQQDAVTGVGTSLLPGFESVDGPQGSLTMVQQLLTNNPDPGYHIVYRDTNLLAPNPCTGDDSDVFGASGPQLNSAINNTDEANKLTYGGGQFSNVFYQRDIFYGAPGQANGPQRLAEEQAPLQLSVNEVDLTGQPGTIVVKKNAVPDDAQDFSFTAGGGLSPVSFSLDDDADGTLSDTQTFSNVDPGTYSVTEAATSGWEQTAATCDDGSPPSAIDLDSGETVTCTFTNSKNYGYARPKGATPLNFRLVPAFDECVEGSANATHGAPLDVPSCNPHSQSSDYLTIGTPDANGKPPVSSGELTLKTVGESPIDPNNGDQSDVIITGSITDVRKQSDLTDYTGELRAVIDLRVTDNLNGASLATPATAVDSPLEFNFGCSPTTGSEGGACNVSTTADALSSGLVREGKRAVWGLGQVQVFDGGADGDADTTGDNTLFEVQGLFAP